MITTKFTIPFASIMIAVCGAFATNNNSVITTNFVPVTLSEHSSVRDGVCDTDVTTKKCRLKSGAEFYELLNPGSPGPVVVVGAFLADQPSNP